MQELYFDGANSDKVDVIATQFVMQIKQKMEIDKELHDEFQKLTQEERDRVISLIQIILF